MSGEHVWWSDAARAAYASYADPEMIIRRYCHPCDVSEVGKGHLVCFACGEPMSHRPSR